MALMSQPTERIALISDVHGNLTALEAVFADIDARGIRGGGSSRWVRVPASGCAGCRFATTS